MSSFSVRAAREGGDGQYVLMTSSEAKLTIDTTRSTITLQTSERASAAPPTTCNLLHVPVHSNLFGSYERKLMLSPASRGAAWIFEFSPAAEALAAIACLRSMGVKVQSPRAADELAIPNAVELDETVERLAGSASFEAYLVAMESALARRERLGLQTYWEPGPRSQTR